MPIFCFSDCGFSSISSIHKSKLSFVTFTLPIPEIVTLTVAVIPSDAGAVITGD